jgi:hypothetical protein
VWLLPLIAATVVIILTGNMRRAQIRAAFHSARFPLAALPLMSALVLTFVLSTFWGYPNLSFAERERYSAECDQNIYILWMGSRAMVLECGSKRYVIMRGEDSLPLQVG